MVVNILIVMAIRVLPKFSNVYKKNSIRRKRYCCCSAVSASTVPVALGTYYIV